MTSIIIGLVSDTHGLFRPAIAERLAGVSLILHAGDVGERAVLDALRTIAPVRAVGGNVDPIASGRAGDGAGLQPRAGDQQRYPASLSLELAGLSIHVSHGHELGSPTPAALLARYTADIIVFGHTHKPLVHRAGHRLVVNPGAAGPKRFNLVPSVARLTIADGVAHAEILSL